MYTSNSAEAARLKMDSRFTTILLYCSFSHPRTYASATRKKPMVKATKIRSSMFFAAFRQLKL